MSALHLSIQCDLDRESPDWVLEYLRGLAAESPVRTSPEIPDDHGWLVQFGSGELPGGDWFDGPFAMVQIHDNHPVSWDFRLHGSFDESAVSWQYAFLKLLARWSADGFVGCSWAGQGSIADVWYVQDGELFSGRGGERPRAVNDERTPLPLPGHMYARPDVRELRIYGLDDDRAGVLAESGNENPALARWLLARRLWRAAVEEADYEPLGREASPRQVAALAVEYILRALDEGRDPDASPDTPGWRLTETPSQSWRDVWPRPIHNVASHLDDLTTDAVAATPVRLEPGMQIRTIRDLPMTATSSEWTSGDSDASSRHQLDVLVPVGTTLTIAEVSEQGHASARSPGWVAWITEQRGKRPDEPREPRSNDETYTLHVIRPLEAGDYWVPSGPASYDSRSC